VLVAIALGYIHPIRAYRDARAEVAGQRSDVSRLAHANARLERRLARAETNAFIVREARRLGLVRPGERLFIITGVGRWQKERARRPGIR
jgi:cell division protein FtsB